MKSSAKINVLVFITKTRGTNYHENRFDCVRNTKKENIKTQMSNKFVNNQQSWQAANLVSPESQTENVVGNFNINF